MKESMKSSKGPSVKQAKNSPLADQRLAISLPKVFPKYKTIELPPEECSYPSCRETVLFKDGLCWEHYEYENSASK